MKLFHFHLAEEEMEALVNEFDLHADGRWAVVSLTTSWAARDIITQTTPLKPSVLT